VQHRLKSIGWPYEAQGLSWTLIEPQSNRVQITLRDARKVGPSWEVGVCSGSMLSNKSSCEPHRNGPLIFGLYPLFGIRCAGWFLGCSEWLFAALLFLGFWDKRPGILGALGSTTTFIVTVTIIAFMPSGWDPVAGFPAMAGNVPFLMKDIVLLAASIYLLKQDAT
jgi:hypothetical protein